MKKLLSFCLLLGLSAALLASEESGSGASSSSASSSSAASSSSSAADLDKAVAELKESVWLKVDDGTIELIPSQVKVLSSGVINGALFEVDGELEGPLDFSETITLEVAQIIATILDEAVHAGAGENALKRAIEQNITDENAWPVIYVLTFLDSPLAAQVMQFVLDSKKISAPKDEKEQYAIMQQEKIIGRALSVALLPCWTCIKTLTGHDREVLSVAFSPDGKNLASGSWDKTVRIWDVSSGACIKTLAGHGDWIDSVAFSPDGKHVASGGFDNTVRIWDVSSGACIKTLDGHDSTVNSVAFSPDGKHVASGSHDKTVRIWDVSSGACIKTLTGHSSDVYSVTFSPDGTNLASGGRDETVRIWDESSGACIKTFTGHGGWVNSVAFSPDGKHVASGSHDKTVRIWDMSSGACIKTLTGHHWEVLSVTFSPDGKYLVSGGDDSAVRIWDVSSGACIKALTVHGGPVRSVAFSPDGKYLASGGRDETVRIWGLADESSSLNVLEQWYMLIENARSPFKNCMQVVSYVTSVFRQKISDLMSKRAPAEIVLRFFKAHERDFGMRREEVGDDVVRYTLDFLHERRVERLSGASSSKDS